MIKLDLQSRLPIYEQLKNKIIELVMLGEISPDEQLPSVRAFARDLGVNPNTVQKAYQDLEREGIIYSILGRGSYINSDADVGMQLEEKHLRNISVAVRQAKACGIHEDRIKTAIREIFREETEL